MPSRSTRSLAAGAAALLIASGLTVGAGTAAADPVDTAECGLAQTVEFNDINTGFTTYSLNKEVVGNGTVAPGGTVTYRTTVTGASALIDRIEDYHPAGFQLTRARSSVYYVVGGQTWDDVTEDVQKDSASNSVYLTSRGWTTAGDAKVVLETTYRVPSDATVGATLNSGAGMSIVGFVNGDRVANPINTCVTIREPNPVEAVTGSLGDVGLGGLSSGSGGFGDIATLPATFSAELINGIDFGKLISGLAGS